MMTMMTMMTITTTDDDDRRRRSDGDGDDASFMSKSVTLATSLIVMYICQVHLF